MSLAPESKVSGEQPFGGPSWGWGPWGGRSPTQEPHGRGPHSQWSPAWQLGWAGLGKQNQVEFQATGQGGVPTMSWNGEPFFGQDRFDLFYWRLRESGLTRRWEPRAPFTTKPLRWPVGAMSTLRSSPYMTR